MSQSPNDAYLKLPLPDQRTIGQVRAHILPEMGGLVEDAAADATGNHTTTSIDPRKKDTDTLSGDETHLAENHEHVRDTATLSRDNAMLRRAISQQTTNTNSLGTSTLGEKREIILLIRGMVERIVIGNQVAFKLGRFDLTNKASNEIDLTPYGAMDRGVSRLHAQLHLDDDKLYITDLGSTNGTYLGGVRLDPHQPTLLRKGDELLIGRLQVQVLFR